MSLYGPLYTIGLITLAAQHPLHHENSLYEIQAQ
jgi:hypothetical protein